MSVVKHVQSGVPLIVDERFHILTQLKNFYSNTIASLKLKLTTNGKSERCSIANMENQNKTTTTKNRTKQRKRYPCVNAFSIKKMLAKLFEIFFNFRCRPKIVSKSFFSWEKNQKKHFTNKPYRSNKIVFYMIFLGLKKCFNFLFYLYIQMRMLF